MKKIAVGLIMISMVLHCGTRLGIVSYLLENRDSLALHLGLIEEIAITTCGQSPDSGTLIYIADEADSSNPHPQLLVLAPEIILFIESGLSMEVPGEIGSNAPDTGYCYSVKQHPHQTVHQPPKS